MNRVFDTVSTGASGHDWDVNLLLLDIALPPVNQVACSRGSIPRKAGHSVEIDIVVRTGHGDRAALHRQAASTSLDVERATGCEVRINGRHSACNHHICTRNRTVLDVRCPVDCEWESGSIFCCDKAVDGFAHIPGR